MEQSQNKRVSPVIILIILIFVAGYVLFLKFHILDQKSAPASDSTDKVQKMVTVENTPLVNGVLSAPVGFPQDIPLEKNAIFESSTTYYPDQNARQLSVSYRSSKTVTQKYAEYKEYMKQTGYKITEGDVSSPARAIFGTKENTNLSVVASRSEGGTLIQLSYLLKSVGK